MLAGTGACREPAAPRGLSNLVAYARLFGVVRHFHPSDEVARADWDRLAVAGVSRAEGARSPAELAQRLQASFAPVAPTVRVFVAGQGSPPPAAPGGPKGSEVVAWEHLGVDLGFPGGLFSSKRARRRVADAAAPGAASPETPLTLALGEGVTATIPLAVYAEDGYTLPRREPIPVLPAGPASPAAARDQRIAAVIAAWNVYQHFYPYFDEIGGSWADALEEGLTAAMQEGPRDPLPILQRLLARLKDAHAEAVPTGSGSFRFPDRPPVTWVWIDDRLIVAVVGPGAGALQAGDEILQIDGRPVAAVAAEQESRISAATRQHLRWLALPRLAAGPAGSTVSLQVRGERGPRTVTLERSAPMLPFETEQRPPPIAALRPYLHYVDLTRADDRGFEAALPDLARARGVVFDLRGYPAVSHEALAHLTDRKTKSPVWLMPTITRPDRQAWTYQPIQWTLEPKGPRLAGRFVFLIDGRVMSAGETVAAMVSDAHLGTTLGETTSGTNGNVSSFFVPGDYLLSFTALKTLGRDRGRHHGVGIAPDQVVERTRGRRGRRPRRAARSRAHAAGAGAMRWRPHAVVAGAVVAGAVVAGATLASGFLLLSGPGAAAADRYAGVAAAIARGDAPNTTSVLVMRGGVVEYERYFSGTGPETLQDTRSVGKSITALAVGVAIQRGAIPSVTAPAFAYLRDLDPTPGPIKAAITVEDLLTMSSALDCDDNDEASPGNEARMYPRPSWARWAAALGVRSGYQRDATGRGPWHYCTAGSFLLGQILQRATGQPADRFIADAVLRPIGITRWQFNRSPTGEVLTGGQLRLRTRDLAALGWLVRSGGRWKDRAVVPEGFVRQAITIHRKTPYFEEDYGYQLWRHTYQSPCGQLSGWQMSGNGGNRVVIFDALNAVVVVTRTHYNQGAAMHIQSARLIEGHILPELCRSAGKSRAPG